jgi:hypothetical protein
MGRERRKKPDSVVSILRVQPRSFEAFLMDTFQEAFPSKFCYMTCPSRRVLRSAIT